MPSPEAPSISPTAYTTAILSFALFFGWEIDAISLTLANVSSLSLSIPTFLLGDFRMPDDKLICRQNHILQWFPVL